MGEVLVWVLFAVLLVPAGFAGWAIGHYTSLGKGGGATTVTNTVTVTAAATTQSTPTTTAAAGPTTTTASAAGNPAKGKAVFAANSCATCHTFKPAGATGNVGPDLDSAPTADAKTAGMALDAFVKQSIVDPNAYVPSGYPKGVMPQNFGTSLSKSQLNDLVAFIVSNQS